MPTVITYVPAFDTTVLTTTSALAQTDTLSVIDASNNISKDISILTARNVFKIVTSNDFSPTDSQGKFVSDSSTNWLEPYQTVDDENVLQFTSKLSTKIFGFANGTGLLANEALVKSNFVERFQLGVNTIEDASDASGNAGCVTIFNQMKLTAIERFNLSYNAAIPSAPTASNDLASCNIALFRKNIGVATGIDTGVKVTSVTHSPSLSVTLTAATSSAGFLGAQIVWFIHPVTGQIYQQSISSDDANNFNSTANTAIVITDFIAVTAANSTREFNKFYKQGTTLTPALIADTTPLKLTVGTTVGDLTITTQNTLNRANPDFFPGDRLIMVSEGTDTQHPQSIVFVSSGINSIQAAYLNNDITNPYGISLPFEVNDELHFKLTMQSATGQQDTNNVPFTITNSYALKARLTVPA